MHCCEVDSLLTVGAAGGLPLTDDDADRYVAEQVTAAELIGVPDGLTSRRRWPTWPPTSSGIRPSLAVTPAARDAYRLILAAADADAGCGT